MAAKRTQSARIEDLEDKLSTLVETMSDADHDALRCDDTTQVCALPTLPKRPFGNEVSPEREDAILATGDKWVNGTHIHYFLFDSGPFAGPPAERQVVRDAFQIWKDVGIGLTFTEVADIEDAELRIGFLRGDGAWSYVGTVALQVGQTERTMNFGWDITQAGSNGLDTAIHEIGHALGFKHEHQNPNAGIVWNRQAVYDYFARTQSPPWDAARTDHNILNTLDPTTVDGSDWDPNSVMHYAFAAGLIDRPEAFRTGLVPAPGLSNKDKAVVQRFYPPIVGGQSLAQLQPFQSERMDLMPGDQVDFAVIPEHSRTYTFSTFGRTDTVMVLFEDVDGAPVYVKGDDDSGWNRNAQFSVRLHKGRSYELRVRLYYNWAEGETAVMMW
ncbi:MAG: matrixin family metalloprotease [Pseudomonadota bacterium]